MGHRSGGLGEARDLYLYAPKCLEGAFCELRLVAPAFGRWHHAHDRKETQRRIHGRPPAQQADGARLLTTWPSTKESPPRRHKGTAVLTTSSTTPKHPTASRRSSSSWRVSLSSSPR